MQRVPFERRKGGGNLIRVENFDLRLVNLRRWYGMGWTCIGKVESFPMSDEVDGASVAAAETHASSLTILSS